MFLSRRTLLAVLPLALAAGQAQAAAEILRVSGEVTPANYGGLESFLFNSMDQVVGLKLSFPANQDAAEGELSASQEGQQFVAYLREPQSESEIVARDTVAFQHGSYILDGFFVVKSGGMHQGIVSLSLEKTDEGAILVSGATIKDLAIDRLQADIRKQ